MLTPPSAVSCVFHLFSEPFNKAEGQQNPAWILNQAHGCPCVGTQTMNFGTLSLMEVVSEMSGGREGLGAQLMAVGMGCPCPSSELPSTDRATAFYI